jgi:hypothetical protein
MTTSNLDITLNIDVIWLKYNSAEDAQLLTVNIIHQEKIKRDTLERRI